MLERPSNAVFVSYRRRVSQFLAQLLYENLTSRGIDVFYDLEKVHAGRFKSIILAQVAARPYMVVVLQHGALDDCVNSNDWFRREMEAALDQNRMLVPVFTSGFDFDDIGRFLPPDTAEALLGFNMLEIPPKYFKYAVQELADNYLTPIQRELTQPPKAAVAAEAAARSQPRSTQVTPEEAVDVLGTAEFQDVVDTEAEFRRWASYLVSQPIEIRRLAAEKISSLSPLVTLDEILGFSRSPDVGVRTAAGIGLLVHLDRDPTLASDKSIQEAADRGLADDISFVRYRYARLASEHGYLAKALLPSLAQLASTDRNVAVRLMARRALDPQ